MQEELGAAEFDGYSNDETVRVVMSGNQEPKSVDITEEAIAGGPEVHSGRCVVAVVLETSAGAWRNAMHAAAAPYATHKRLSCNIVTWLE